MLQEIQGNKLVSWTILNFTKSLADMCKFWNYASYLKWSSSTNLTSIWKSLTLSIDCKYY